MRHLFVILGIIGSLYAGETHAQCQFVASPVVSDVSCNLGSDGAISITASGGTAPFFYNWSNGSTTATITNIPAGNYSVTVTDAFGCKDTLSNIGVKQPGPFIYNAVIHNVSCFGGNDGSLDFTLSGGTPPYNYVWTDSNNMQIGTTAYIGNLTAGRYRLAVTDANGCRGGITYIIAQAAQMNIQGVVNDPSCPGDSDGSVLITVTGGTGRKSYSWSSGERSRNIFNKPAGSYTVTVTDVNGCTALNSFTINDPPPLNAAASITSPGCIGSSDGALDITVSGGTPPYTFSWSTGAATEDISNLIAGDYCVTITDSANCLSDSICFTVNDPTEISVTADVTDVTCPGNADGAIDVTASGGNPPYSYSWSNGDTSEDLTELAAGIYTVTVTDANGCTAEGAFIVKPANIIIISVGLTQPLCGESNGSATVTISGGEAPFTVQWSNGQSGATIDSMAAGSYGVTVTDANGCTASTIADLSDVSTLSVTGNVANTLCGSGDIGSISVTVTGGSGYYTFSWSTGALTGLISGLGAGSYSVTVTDSLGCEAVSTFNVIEESDLSITANTTSPDCNQSNGSIDLTVTGGTPPYSYSWSSGQTSSSISGLESGVYAVTVTDSAGCEEIQIIVLQDVSAPQISINKEDITCDNPTGSLEVVINSGTPPFTIIWTTGDTTASISGLAPGMYGVEVTDSAGCTAAAFEILLPALGVVIEASPAEPTCNGSSDASIDVTVIQGNPPYDYSWSTGDTTEDIANLASGTYDVTVTDAGGCSATTAIVIDEPEEITAIADSLDELECNDSTGSINISVDGGVSPYAFNWSNGDTTEDLTEVAAGEYCVVIVDANGCISDTFCFTLNEPPRLQIQPDITQPICNGSEDGSISVTVTGGTEPYSYSWNTNDTVPDISGLAAGTYSLTVTDLNGCTAEGDFTITDPDSVVITIVDSSDVKCNGANDGSITIQVTGGTAPYNYSWSTGDTTQNVTGLSPDTTYQVTATDANGCSDTSDVVIIDEPDSLLVTGNITQPVCTLTGTIDAIVTGGTPPYTYSWSTGEDSSSITGIGGGGVFVVSVTDSNGCTDSASFTIAEPPVMDVLIVVTQPVPCTGDTSGELCASVDGVPGPYFYSWSTGDSTECISGQPAGTYSVTVSNGSGCSAYENAFILEEPDSITISPTVNNLTCFGGDNGSVIASVSGGTPPYTFQWSNGESGNIADSLPAGEITVIVTDSNGCSSSLPVNVSQPDPFDFSGTVVNPTTCDTTIDGSISVEISGGTPPYSFVWNDQVTGPVRENLGEGTYYVTVTDENGCTGTDSFTIDGPVCNQPPAAIVDTARLFVCINESIDIPVLDNDYDPDGDDIYVAAIHGTPFSGTVHVNADQTITYVPAADYIGIDTFRYIICEMGTQPSLCDTTYVVVAVLPCKPNISIPDGFSPDGDGVNDGFIIPGIEFFPDNELLIFNRWGNLVREFHGYKNEWTGTNKNGEALPDGTYYFVLKLNNEENTIYSGYLIIHR